MAIDREQLIKKAAEAMVEYDNPGAYERGDVIANWDDYVGAARAAFAVFEQAHTPTDDEREVALIEKIKLAGHVMSEGMIYPNSDYPVKAIPYTRFLEILSGFRRTVQGESIRVNPDAQIPYVGTTDDFVVNTRAQGGSSIRDHIRALTGLTELGGFQGEPTDAQVLAALNARELSVRERSGIARHFNPAPDLSYYSEGNVADMRAALRAAFNETGEKHG